MAQKKFKKDWLEPPEWWKKVKPLRWIMGALVLVGIGTWVRALLPEREPAPREPVETAAAPPPAEPAPAPEPAPAVTPEPAPVPVEPPPVEPEPTPEPEPQPEPVRPAPPTPGPGADSAWEVNSPEIADYKRVERDRLLMMDQFKSYDAVDAVKAELEKQGYAVIATSNHRSVRGDVPPYDLDTLLVETFKHLNSEGRLTMSFFNDRLYEVEFQPATPEPYLRELRKRVTYMRRGETGRSEYIEGNLRMASSLELATSDVGKALRTRPFVLWQDRRLVRQRDDWDYKFAKSSG